MGNTHAPRTPEAFTELQAARMGDVMAGKMAYQAVIGSPLHLAQGNQPDVAMTVRDFGSLLFCTHCHTLGGIEDVVRYVGCKAKHGITYGTRLALREGYCVATWAACQDNKRSTTV
jgi:hypothetical protein